MRELWQILKSPSNGSLGPQRSKHCESICCARGLLGEMLGKEKDKGPRKG